MKRKFLYIIFFLLALSGVLQFLLLPGLAWNFLFPFLQITILLLSLKISKEWEFLKVCAGIIGVLTLLDFGLNMYSSANLNSFESKQEIKVMSYNLYFKNRAPAKSIEVIKKTNADLLVVQELTPKWAAELRKAIGSQYRYKILHALKGTHGIGVYSKFPLSNQKLLNNSSGRPFAQIVDITIQGKKSQLINTHLASPAIAVENRDNFIPLFLGNYKKRRDQLKQINEHTHKTAQKYQWQLMIGDLNTLQSEPIFKNLNRTWVNSICFPTRWMNFNFPNSAKSQPLITLDYILGRGKMKLKNHKVIEGGRSDHLAISAEIEI